MNSETVKALIQAGISAQSVQVDGGDGRYNAVVVSDEFEGLGRVKRQQCVYTTLQDEIASGAIHAITIRALTAAEAET